MPEKTLRKKLVIFPNMANNFPSFYFFWKVLPGTIKECSKLHFYVVRIVEGLWQWLIVTYVMGCWFLMAPMYLSRCSALDTNITHTSSGRPVTGFWQGNVTKRHKLVKFLTDFGRADVR